MQNRDDITYTALSELRDRLPRLDDALAGGTPRRWNEREMTDAERERQDARAFQERAAKEWNARRGLTALGDGRAPLSLAVLDATTEVNAGIAEIERAACEWLGLTPLAGATPRERVTRIVGLLGRIEAIDELAQWVEEEAKRLNRAARGALGDTEPVHRIKARCPVCDALSLRAFPERELVICVNGACICDDDGCACSGDRPRRHTWPSSQWTWLAQVLGDDLEQSAAS